MSKSIIIDEAGLPKALTVDALRTSKQGGGTEDWVPTDGKNLVELDIGGSGTYRASDYGAYGISVARVTPKYGGGATSKAAQQPVFANLHTPAIREGGNPAYMSARLLKTNLQGGGTCLWVPEDEVNLESIYVDHSGTYIAHADGCYGFDQITVSGVDVEITQDEDGDDVAKTTDGGVVTEEKLPSSIAVVTPPSKLEYNDGETINFNGMVVKAYLKSGTLWTDSKHPNGIIPIDELELPVTIADFDSAEGKTAQSDLDTYPIQQPFPLTRALHIAHCRNDQEGNRYVYGDYIYHSDAVMAYKTQNTAFTIVFAGPTPETTMTSWHKNNSTGREDTSTSRANTQYTFDGKTVYYGVGTYGLPSIGYWLEGTFANNGDIVSGNLSHSVYGAIAWTMVYGTINDGRQVIPVQYMRIFDDKILESSFVITVTGGTP